MQPLLSGYFVDRPSTKVRTYLADSLRFSPRRRRLVAQWGLVSALASPLGLRLTRRRGLAFSPDVSDARDCLVVPGNQRVRVFDFHRRIVTVGTKVGFAPEPMQRELATRARLDPVWSLAVLDGNAAAGWFQEPIFDAYALPRCPPWFPKAQLQARALALVETWAERDAQTIASRDYVERLANHCIGIAEELGNRFRSADLAAVKVHARRLSELATRVDEVRIGPSHGDFQAGNVLIGKRDQAIKIIDWEHGSTRSLGYDRSVLGLGMRARVGLAERVAAALDGPQPPWLSGTLRGTPVERRAWLHLSLLEDLEWALSEATTGTYRALPAGLRQLLAELSRVGR